GNEIFNLNQGASGCQEGNAIEVRNFGTSPSTVRATIDGNKVTNYQKTGIVANGDVDATITDNTVAGGAPLSYIARNGIQARDGDQHQDSQQHAQQFGRDQRLHLSGGRLRRWQQRQDHLEPDLRPRLRRRDASGSDLLG